MYNVSGKAMLMMLRATFTKLIKKTVLSDNLCPPIKALTKL